MAIEMRMTRTTMLEVRDVRISHGRVPAVHGASLAVGEGRLVAIVGSTGSADAQMAAFRLAWWVMAVITSLGLLPLLLLRRWRHTPAGMTAAEVA